MGRSVMRYFRRSSRSPYSSSENLNAFYDSLSEDLNQLDQSLSDGSISLKWPVEAMKILKKMQFQQLALLKNSKLLTISTGAKNGWFDRYMQDSIAMLDFCNLLKFAVSRINRQRMMEDIIIQNLSSNGSTPQAVSSKTIQFEKLQNVHQKKLSVTMMRETVRLGCRVQAEGSSKEDMTITAVMLAANSTMVVVWVLLVSAIVSPISIELGGSDVPSKFPQLKLFFQRLSTLVRRFHESASAASKGSGSVLLEQEVMRRMIVDLQTQVVEGVDDKERFLSSVELLRSRSVELKRGMDKLDAAVDDVFDVIIRGRNEILRVVRDRDLYLG